MVRRRPHGTLAAVCLVAAVGLLGMPVRFTVFDAARSTAVAAQRNAEAERSNALWAVAPLRGLGYAISIGLAQRELQAGTLSHAEEVLNGCQPELRDWEHRYLVKLCQDKEQALQERPAPIRGRASARTGAAVATASANWTIKLWDTRTGALLQPVPRPYRSRLVRLFQPRRQAAGLGVATTAWFACGMRTAAARSMP